MLSISSPFEDKLNEFFYEGMDRQTSVHLYGSAATGHWFAGRSDLDLVVIVPKKKLELLGEKIRAWASTPAFPILDGYALSCYGRSLETMRLDQFLRVTFPSNTSIDLIDQWNIKYRAKQLFGKESINRFFPDISQDELRTWAIKEIRLMSMSNPKGYLQDIKVVLSELIWSVSWTARMLMLISGHICESKQEALQWLASEYAEIRSLVSMLLDDYAKSDKEATSINSEQSLVLRRFCLRLLLQEIK